MKGEIYKKDVIAWCMYDWANSAFAVVVLTAFFPVLFRMLWDSGANSTLNTGRLGLGEAAAGLLVAALSPVLGAIADAGRAKKAFLVFFMIVGSTTTCVMFFIGQAGWIAALCLFVVANIGFSCGNLFYDSLLVDVAEEKNMDMVSSLGYAVGYVGGGLCYLFDVLLVMFWSQVGLKSQLQAMQIAFLTVAVWWFVFSFPLIYFVKERQSAESQRPFSVVASGLARLKTTCAKIVHDRLLVLFIVAFWLYMDGVYTVITMSVNFGLSIGIAPKTLMLTILLVQFVAFPAAIGFGYLARIIGSGRTILCGIAVYIAVCAIGFFILRNAVQFIVLACFVAMAQGGVQALSRSYFAKVIPGRDAAEYFGFLNLISRFSIVLGPLLVGGVTLLCHHIGISDILSSRLGMSSITLTFAAGGILLLLAEQERKRRITAV